MVNLIVLEIRTLATGHLVFFGVVNGKDEEVVMF